MAITGFSQYVRLAMRLPLRETLRRGARLGVRVAAREARRGLDALRPSAAQAPQQTCAGPRLAIEPEVLRGRADSLLLFAEHSLDHHFDLLGSGWVRVHYGMECAGIEGLRYPPGPAVTADRDGRWLAAQVNRANLGAAQQAWRLIFQGDWARPDYRPIDWQIDFRSGYRWSAQTHFSRIRVAPKAGADIKLPRELARMQHLPQLALAHCLGHANAAAEIRAQILDFIAVNPPRFGVNWACAMDVGIRVANWLLALWILESAGLRFDAGFRRLFDASIEDHARQILATLEWAEEPRSNHYLADLVGLLFCLRHLPATTDNAERLAFVLRELYFEIDQQFLPDGGNYEASSGYHRLSGELAIFGLALARGLPPEKLRAAQGIDRRGLKLRPPERRDPRDLAPPKAILEKLQKAAELALDLTRPDHCAWLIGDQDSGRLFKLAPRLDSDQREISHDHRALAAAAAGLFDRPDLAAETGADLQAYRIVASGLAGDSPFPAAAAPFAARHRTLPLRQPEPRPEPQSTREIAIPLPPGLAEGLRCAAYPDFGVFIWSGPRLFVGLRCFAADTPAVWGHGHDDNLAVELWSEGGRPHVLDPGTYCYTSFPAQRALWQSAAAHFVPRLAGKPAQRVWGAFAAAPVAEGWVEAFDLSGATVWLDGDGWRIRRRLEITSDGLRIVDNGWGGELVSLPPQGNSFPFLSQGYGRKTPRPAVFL